MFKGRIHDNHPKDNITINSIMHNIDQILLYLQKLVVS